MEANAKLLATELRDRYPDAFFKAEEKWLNTLCRPTGVTNNMLRHQGYSLVKASARYNWRFSADGEKL